jgi:hypothetical protein
MLLCWKASGDKQNTRTAFTTVIKSQDLKGKDKDLEKFITPQYYQ